MSLRVVLVGPENPLNVGFVSRAMRASGAGELVIAGSAWTAMPAQAHVTGGSATEILDGARFVKELPEALEGCRTAIAFSRRPSALKQREFILPDAPPLKGKTALVFGRESAGLTREETALCSCLARIPAKNGVSLNLGQAAAVALFALAVPQAKRTAEPGAASLGRTTALWDYVKPRLEASPRFSAERLRRARQAFFRMNLDDAGMDVLFSVLKTLSK